MKAYNVTEMQLSKALAKVNKKYKGNVIFKAIKPTNGKGTSWQFTLTVKDSSKPGHRRGFNHPTWTNKDGSPHKPMRMKAACWHVHGDFFDAVFDMAKDAKIRTGKAVMNSKMDNWQDTNIGSIMYPQMFSDACDCGKE